MWYPMALSVCSVAQQQGQLSALSYGGCHIPNVQYSSQYRGAAARIRAKDSCRPLLDSPRTLRWRLRRCSWSLSIAGKRPPDSYTCRVLSKNYLGQAAGP